MEVEYGTIGIIPDGEWDSAKQYELMSLVSYDGSSYVAHTKPPIGTLPTDANYWQVSATGTSKATAGSLGVVKPDGDTLEVDADGVLSAMKASQTTPGIVKGSAGIAVGADGSIDVDTDFQEATELANFIAGEAIAQVLSKTSKAIATIMNLNQNALLKNMLTSVDVNDDTKVPTSSLIHTIWEKIGMGEELNVGSSIVGGLNQLNSDLGIIKHYNFRNPDYTDATMINMVQDYYAQIPNNTIALCRYQLTGPELIALVQKTTDEYGSFIAFGYSTLFTKGQLVNSVWTVQNF